MKKNLFPETGTFFKANLHCHTSVSDGKYSPAETKEIYKTAGYAAVAFTDHEALVDHTDLTDPDFVALNGVEVDINAEGYISRHMPVYHLNFIAKTPGQDVIPCFNRTYNSWLMDTPGILEHQKCIGPDDYERHYEKVGEVVHAFKEAGFFATLNHPTWSLQDIGDYLPLTGLDAFEVFNSGCYYTCGYDEINVHEYDALLRRGKRLGIIAADDNHGRFPVGNPYSDLARAWVSICADKLDYQSVISSLEAGNYYASNGPSILSMTYEDGYLYVQCSPATRVTCVSFGRHCQVEYPKNGEQTVTKATFRVDKDDVYFRITVSDGKEHYAWSRAYFLDDTLGIPMAPNTFFRK